MTAATAIDRVDACALRIPTEAAEADGTLRWDATEMVVLEIHCGAHVGLGYSYTAGRAARDLVNDTLAELLLGENALHIPRLWRRMNDALRNVGRPGLGLMAIAAVDQALWDLKAKLLGLPLTSLWGEARPCVFAYASGGFVNQSDGDLHQQLLAWLEAGFWSMKIKIGTDRGEDSRRVALAREIIGPERNLMLDCNGAYERRDALALIEAISPHQPCWLEEPVTSDDPAGLNWLRDRAPAGLAIAAGEYGWDLHYFRNLLQSGAVDVLQADATRCGYTGFRQVADLCVAFSIPLSAHCAPAAHLPLCLSVPTFKHLEYFHDHVRIESLIFQHHQRLEAGTLRPAVLLPGHGITLNRCAADNYRLE